MNTRHASSRSQQRGIPPLIDQWLDAYGEEIYDGRGGIRIYFSKRSIRDMERAFGREPIRRLSEYFDAYKVTSSHDGATLTIGHLYRRIRRN